MLPKINIDDLNNIAIKAGEIARKYYYHDNVVNFKTDESPVTEADIAVNDYLINSLRELTPNIPIISEEDSISNKTILDNQYFWLVDPIDGTKSFIKKSGNFTINIALIYNNYPIVGIIYEPILDELYFSDGIYSYCKIDNIIKKLKVNITDNKIKVLASKTITHDKIHAVLPKDKIQSINHVSSSIKFCMIAKGEGDLYPCLNEIMEWDSAAGQAIVEQAGGKVIDQNGVRLKYRKKDFKNPIFFVTNE